MRFPLHPFAFGLLALALTASTLAPAFSTAQEAKPLRALLICGGCCHDYAKQHVILSKGISERANVVVDVVHSEDRGTTPRFPIYEKADWAKGYDVIIHDECAAGIKDLPYVENILQAHKTVPAVNLHCAMHCYRTGTDHWFKYLGLQSSAHGPQEPIAITFADKAHPITKGLADWTTIKEELYNNIDIFDAHPLAMGRQMVKGQAVESVVAWTNQTLGARTFSTTIGHNNETVADPRYLDLVTRGLLWACDKLDADHLKAYQGPPGSVTNLLSQPKGAEKATATPPPAPKDAVPVTLSASSEESGKQNYVWRAVDGNKDTRWCAANGTRPQWLQLEFDAPRRVSGVRITWESDNNIYHHKIEGSTDGKTWTLLTDATHSAKPGDSEDSWEAANLKFIKITGTGTSAGGWISIRELTLQGDGLKALAPKLSQAQQAAAQKEQAKANDPYAKEGINPPSIRKLTPEQEKAILSDVKIPDGFEMTLFASPPAVNYPVFVAAAPDGTLYVSSDGNGSLGRNPKRGRILRLRDLDGDGRADETKVFCEVDSPRGLVWDHDRLYLVHPPDVSAFIDRDGDGVAEEKQTLIKGIAFGFADRPADHTTNGLSLGIDGWLYIAGGDFGFMDAVGTDGRHLQHRGGGVIRLRPDGSGLEVYATGTRNILEVSVSPTMEIFARDNTNDGGGWDVRFHHFVGGENHGYPRLFKNFNEECIQPLAIYGGGSGCGALYLDEPGFPAGWNDRPYTCDWGTGALWRHTVQASGATYAEPEKPEPFIRMTRPTDGDVDGMSHVYQASWKGATFNWEGPDVGYIVQVKPNGFQAAALPDFATLGEPELITLLESPSSRRRLEAQRTLIRRGLTGDTVQRLKAVVADPTKPLAARTAALFATVGDAGSSRTILDGWVPQEDDKVFGAVLARFLAETAGFHAGQGPLEIPAACQSPAGLVQLNRMIVASSKWNEAARRQVFGASLNHSDPVVTHTASRALAATGDATLALAFLDDAGTAKTPVFRALAMMHQPEIVSGLITRMDRETNAEIRKGLLYALCRLHFQEGEWKGDSWGTRPDTRGPYYQPETWSESPRIAAALKEALTKAPAEEAGYLVGELNRNRIQFGEALTKILALAAKSDDYLADAVAQLASADPVPTEAVPLLVRAARQENASAETLAQALAALSRTDGSEGCQASLAALVSLAKTEGSGKEQESGQSAFFEAPKLENHHQLLEQEAEKLGTPTSVWADAALLKLSARKTGSPESRELSAKALDLGWQNAQRRAQILKAVALIKFAPYADKVLASLDDADKAVAQAAKSAAGRLRLEKKAKMDQSPKLAGLTPEEIVTKVTGWKGEVALGEQLFTRLTCVACHTVNENQPPKGPYLGNIAQTYKRPDLAWAILDPNKTIAQGFVTEVFSLKDGTQQMGFVTLESAEQVKVRNVAAQEFTYAVKDITSRQKLPTSIMPPGLVATLSLHELASLLDYLESLVKK